MKTSLHSTVRTLASLVGAALLANATASAQTVTWNDIGPGTFNYDPAKPAQQPGVAVVPGSQNKMYAIWVERNGSGVDQIRVSVYHSDVVSNWTFVDRKVNGAARAESLGINRVPTKSAYDPVIQAMDGNLFAAWTEGGQVRVAVYNADDASSNWTFIDGNSSTRGLNYGSTQTAREPQLMAFNGKLYAAWHEQGSKVKGVASWQIRVKALNPLTMTWSFVDGGGANGINFSTTKNAANVRLAVLPGATAKLYASWHESNGSRNLARVKVYSGSGSSWSGADGGGLNYSTSANGNFPSLFAFNSKMYVFWEESLQIRVRSYDGANDAAPTWTLVDGGGAAGINQTADKWAWLPSVAEVGGKMFVAFTETNSDGLNGVLRVSSYNGDDSAPGWSSESGGNGLGADPWPKLTNLDGQLHCITILGVFPASPIYGMVRTESP